MTERLLDAREVADLAGRAGRVGEGLHGSCPRSDGDVKVWCTPASVPRSPSPGERTWLRPGPSLSTGSRDQGAYHRILQPSLGVDRDVASPRLAEA